MPKPKTIALAREYQARAQELLNLIADNGVAFEAPAQVLTGLTKLIGWRLEFPELPADRWSECDRLRRVIRVTRDLADRVEFPGQTRAISHSCIAHEIAHALLHSGPRVSRRIPKAWEFEARVFASVLLCPWSLVSARPEVLALRGNCLTMAERWARVRDLADHFRVTTGFMVASLVLHGVLERTPGGGIQAPTVLGCFARPFQKAA